MGSSQTFVGFANGRYIFSSTDGFFNYVRNPAGYVECQAAGSPVVVTVENGACPAGTTSSARCCSTCSRPGSTA